VRLVGVAGVGGEARQLAARVLVSLREREKALEAQHPVQDLRREADRLLEAPPQLAFGDVQLRGKSRDVPSAPG
jgi:hypothetical protein